MISLALITEGITDRAILEIIAESVCSKAENVEIDVNVLRPLPSYSFESRDENFGGWEMVLDQCGRSEEIEQAMIFNDLLVIHIDADAGEHTNFGVPLTSNDGDREPCELVAEIAWILMDRLGVDLYVKFEKRILFAIAVQSIECWLLPVYETRPAAKSREKNCAHHLARALRRKNVTLKKEYETNASQEK